MPRRARGGQGREDVEAAGLAVEPQVAHDDVRARSARRARAPAAAVGRGADELDVVAVADRGLEGGGDGGMVVDDREADHGASVARARRRSNSMITLNGAIGRAGSAGPDAPRRRRASDVADPAQEVLVELEIGLGLRLGRLVGRGDAARPPGGSGRPVAAPGEDLDEPDRPGTGRRRPSSRGR